MAQTKKQEKKKGIQFKGERTRSTLIVVAGLILFLVNIFADFTPGYTLILAAVSTMATYELIKAVGCKSKILFAVAGAVSVLSVLTVGFRLPHPPASVVLSFYAIVLLVLAVIFNKEIRYTDSVMAFFASVAVPYAFSCFIRLNNFSDVKPGFSRWEECFLVAMVFACSWLTDSFAFLVGRKIGKHKMTPVISPKKSVEGAIGGIVITMLFNLAFFFIFDYFFFKNDTIKWWMIPATSMFLSAISIGGDLSASVIKRNFSEKDFGTIFPGHGGIMDRFDSYSFVMPMLYAIISLILSVGA